MNYNLMKFLFLAMLSLLLAACGQKASEKKKFSQFSDLNSPDVIVGYETGTTSGRSAEKHFPKAKHALFNSPADMFLALESGKADAVAYDYPSMEYAALAHKKLQLIPSPLDEGCVSIAAAKGREALMQEVNAYVDEYRLDGTYADMYRRWVETGDTKMPDISPVENPKGALKIGITIDNEPFCMISHNKPSGFDVEFSFRLCQKLQMKPEFVSLSYDALVTALAGKKIDLAIAMMDSDPERAKNVLFSKSYVDCPIGVMLRKENCAKIICKTFAEFNGHPVGVLSGSIQDIQARETFKKSMVRPYNSISQLTLSLDTAKVDGILLDEPQFRIMQFDRPDYVAMEETVPMEGYAMLFSKEKAGLCREFSQEIDRLKADGTLKELQEKWFCKDYDKVEMPPLPKGEKTVKMVTAPEIQPFTFMVGEKIVGYEIEIACIVCNNLGYGLDLTGTDFGSLIPGALSGKYDLAGSCISITEERKQSGLFSSPIYEGGTVLVQKKPSEDESQDQFLSGIFSSFKESFEKTFIREQRYRLILEGLAVTLVITVLSVLLGTILALPVCGLIRSGNPVLRWLGNRYVSLVQGIPILVILMVLYYVVFASSSIPAFIVATIGFGLDFAAYMSVTLKASIDALPKGQWEAAAALGFKPMQGFFCCILPQAVKAALPTYRSEIIATLKSTSIVGYIAIQDLTKAGDIIRSRTYEAFFPLISTAIIYFMTAKLLALLLVWLENRTNPASRRDRMLKKGENAR